MITNSGSANGTTHFVHDQWGNIIAELDATGATVREYIWLVGAEIAPTRGSRTQVDRPIAVVSNVNTTPALLTVHPGLRRGRLRSTQPPGADDGCGQGRRVERGLQPIRRRLYDHRRRNALSRRPRARLSAGYDRAVELGTDAGGPQPRRSGLSSDMLTLAWRNPPGRAFVRCNTVK